MSQPTNGQRRTPAGERRRAELMEAAVNLAARQGFGRMRVSDVVGHVGVGQGVFYWYFESKDALFREILDDTTKRLRLYQGAFIGEEPDPVRRIAKGIVASFDFIVRNVHVFALLDHEQARIRQTRRQAGRIHMLDTARQAADAMEQGLARETDPIYPARAISGVVNQLTRDYFASGDRDLDRAIQEAIDFCIGGLTGPRTITVAQIRGEVEITPELKRVRDKVGAAAHSGAAAVPPSRSQ